MRRRPVIGLTTYSLEDAGPEIARGWALGHRYVDVLTESAALPWLVPLLNDDPDTLRGIYERLDGVFLAGGADIDPSTYGEPRHALCGRSDSARDATAAPRYIA